MSIYSLAERKVSFAGAEWYVADTAAVIGSVALGNESSVWFHVVIRGDSEIITIGARTNIQDGAVLHADPGSPLTLGSNVSVGHKAMLHGCTVGDGSLIGINSVVLNGGQHRQRHHRRRRRSHSGGQDHSGRSAGTGVSGTGGAGIGAGRKGLPAGCGRKLRSAFSSFSRTSRSPVAAATGSEFVEKGSRQPATRRSAG